MRALAHSLCLGWLAVLASSCTIGHPQDPLASAAPLEFVAWLCADTCRIEFAASDPLPYHAGAPATRLADGSYEVRYQRRADGRWAPRAAGRLVAPRRPTTEPPEDIDYVPANGLIGWRSADAELVVHVARSPAGATVSTASRGFAAEAVQRHLRAAAEFAAALARPSEHGAGLRSCCAQHAPWRAVALLRAASDHLHNDRLLAARDALRATMAVAPDLQGLDYRIGCLDRDLGQDALAAPRLRIASLREPDPAVRSNAALSARDSAARGARPDATLLRQQALAQLDAGRVASARALAHAANASHPDPVADLRLRHRLQRARKDRFGSLGTALLLREYGADPSVDRLLAEDFSQVGHWQLARRAAARLLVGQLPASDMLVALQAASEALAENAWIGWAEAVGAWAAPPR